MAHRTALSSLGSNQLNSRQPSTLKGIAQPSFAKSLLSQPTPVSRPVNQGLYSPKVDSHLPDPDGTNVQPYAKDIMMCLHQEEKKRHVSDLDKLHKQGVQAEISPKMRSVLIDWMVDVHLKFKLHPETLFLAVDILDRFLSVKTVQRSKLQLAGIGSLLIASKYEEIYAPTLRNLITISGNAYSRNDLIHMELVILHELKYEITRPTAYQFIVRLCQVGSADSRMRQTCLYMLELALLESQCAAMYPSELAAVVVHASQTLLKQPVVWDTNMAHYSGHEESKIKTHSSQMVESAKNQATAKSQASRKKYSFPKQGGIPAVIENGQQDRFVRNA
eukprot:gene2030-3024_t